VYDELAEAIGRTTRDIRLKAEVPLEQVARALELPPLVLARLERGKLMPSIVTLVRMSLFFGVPVDTLLARPSAKA
jgi:transcriptional regulator with XRE-family HTH domain